MISYEYIAHQKLIVITIRGRVTPGESINLIKKVWQNKEVAPESDVILDSTDGVVAFTSAEIKKMAVRSSSGRIKAEGAVKQAIIAPDDLNFGLSRMYEAEAAAYSPYTIRVFRAWNEALAWLDRDPSLAEVIRRSSPDHNPEGFGDLSPAW